MKTKKEIEHLAIKDFNNRQECGHYELADLKSRDYYYDGFINGYTQCQEDMVEKYTEQDMIKFAFDTYYQEDMAKKYTEEDMLFAFVHGGTKFEENKDADTLAKNFKELINSLNKQDI